MCFHACRPNFTVKGMVSHLTLSSVIHNPITSVRPQASQSQITRRERLEAITQKQVRLGRNRSLTGIGQSNMLTSADISCRNCEHFGKSYRYFVKDLEGLVK